MVEKMFGVTNAICTHAAQCGLNCRGASRREELTFPAVAGIPDSTDHREMITSDCYMHVITLYSVFRT